MDQVESDYCVVGGGCAGATAALRVFQAGRTVALLEARDRVGGRVWTREHSGIPIDYGGQWLGSGQERAYGLVKELGIQTYPTWTKGQNVFVISGKVRKYPRRDSPGRPNITTKPRPRFAAVCKMVRRSAP